MMEDCPRCGTRMSANDQTTKLTEFVCPRCHATNIQYKTDARGRTRAALGR